VEEIPRLLNPEDLERLRRVLNQPRPEGEAPKPE
jgi:hypothetical protein